MNKKLKTALIISPVIALYGIAPFYLMSQAGFINIAFSFISLSIMIFFFWTGNIWLLSRKSPQWIAYTISYTATFSIHLVILLIIPDLATDGNQLMFFAYPLISTIAINSIILIILNAQTLKEKKESVEVELQKVKVENLEAQKKMLQQQLQPHFLFNALSTLKSLIKSDTDMAVDYTLDLSEFLRYSQIAAGLDKVTVAEELRFTNHYLSLQKIRYDDAFICSVQIPDKVLDKKIPVFAIQLLIENALKHNRISSVKPLLIEVRFDKNYIIVSNNKSLKPLVPKSGTGLRNLNNRYRLLFNEEMIIDETESSYTVKLPVR